MKISANNSINFRAALGGEIEKIKNISREANVSEDEINGLLQEVHQIYPDKNNRVCFLFRRYSSINQKDSTPMIRSGVRIEKQGDFVELNIDPRNIKQKDLLKEMVSGIKRLANGQAQPNQQHIWYKVGDNNSWLSDYDDRRYI